MRNLAILIGVSVALWGLSLVPAIAIGGTAALRHSGVALVLCLIPAAATFAAIGIWSSTPDQRMLATLASSGIRMAISLGVGWVLYETMPALFPAAFLYWLAGFYVAILALEVGLLARQQSAASLPESDRRTLRDGSSREREISP